MAKKSVGKATRAKKQRTTKAARAAAAKLERTYFGQKIVSEGHDYHVTEDGKEHATLADAIQHVKKPKKSQAGGGAGAKPVTGTDVTASPANKPTEK